MDAATKSLDHILKSGEYSVVKDIPVFDEHDEHDADGKLLRKFDRKALQKIVDECNRRAKDTGDLSPHGPGHTINDAPEHLQPVTYGYATNYKIGEYGPKKKLGILADFYVKNKVTRPDGVEADGIAEFKSYPRRSVELWLRDGFIGHIALLRREPKRELGLVAFAKGQQVTIPSTGQIFTSAKKDTSYAAAVRGGKLCYAMEPDMDQIPAMAAGAPGPNGAAMGGDDDYQKFCSMADKYMKEHFGDNLAKYQVQPTAPGGDMPPNDPTLPPVAKPDDDVVKMSRQFATADPKVQVAMFQRMAQRLEAIEQSSKAQADLFSEEDAVSRVARCASAGCVMDLAAEKLEFMRRPLGKERDDYEKKVTTYHQKDAFAVGRPISGLDFVNTGNGRNGNPQRHSREQIDRAVAESTRTGKDYATILAEMNAK